MSRKDRMTGEISSCCQQPVVRSPKIAGWKPYCTKCNRKCEIAN